MTSFSAFLMNFVLVSGVTKSSVANDKPDRSRFAETGLHHVVEQVDRCLATETLIAVAESQLAKSPLFIG